MERQQPAASSNAEANLQPDWQGDTVHNDKNNGTPGKLSYSNFNCKGNYENECMCQYLISYSPHFG